MAVQGNIDVSEPGNINVNGGNCAVTGNISASGSGTFGTAKVNNLPVSTMIVKQLNVNKVAPYQVLFGDDIPGDPNWTAGVTYIQTVALSVPIELGTSSYSIGISGTETALPYCIVQNILGGNLSGSQLVSVDVVFYCIVTATGSFDQSVGITYNLP